MYHKIISIVAIATLQVLPALAQDRATILILDESGSMWAQLPEGRSRIEVARDVLGDFMVLRDPAAPLGVIAYGHNRRGDCSDIETIARVEIQDATTLTARLRALMPRGKTPLAEALRQAAAEIPPAAEEANIVLVTDGLETCGGDPCAVAAELSTIGIPVQAHVVGFGLTEGEVRQIACVAEQTGGLVLAPQSGAELVDALIRTSEPVTRVPDAQGSAALNLSIRADIAGRPDTVDFTAENLATGKILPVGRLDLTIESALPVDLAEGRWLIRADAGELGRGETQITVVAGDNRTVFVPFQGLMPDLHLPDPTGAFRAGINGLIPYRINQEGLATGGGDFVMSVLPIDATSTTDRRYDYSTQEPRIGGHVGVVRVPAEPGQYLIAFHRNASQPVAEAMRSFVITVEDRPEVVLSAPSAVKPGARVPVNIAGGMGNSDRIEIWRDGALYSWDQSIYVQDFFDNRYGPAKPLIAPAEPGAYEIVYLFSELYDEEAIAARVPLAVGAGALLEEAAAPETGGRDIQKADLSDGGGYSCDQPICMITDAQTGLSFALPQGWFTDTPTSESATVGGQRGAPRVTFMRKVGENTDTIVLNPRQWTAMNGPCQDVTMGELCVFEGEFHDPSVAALLAQTLRWQAPAPQADGHGPDTSPEKATAWEDYPYGCLAGGLCEFTDTATGLSFIVPAGWVATAPELTKLGQEARPQVTFHEAGGNLNTLVLNPADWGEADGPCTITRAGRLCLWRNDTAPDDPVARDAVSLLQLSLTTGSTLRRCPFREACVFDQPHPAISGALPANWSVEFFRTLPDGRYATWFFDHDAPAGIYKLIGLNQPGGANCVEAAPEHLLCEFTPYISTQEVAAIRKSLVLPGIAAPAVDIIQLAPGVAEQLFSIIIGN